MEEHYLAHSRAEKSLRLVTPDSLTFGPFLQSLKPIEPIPKSRNGNVSCEDFRQAVPHAARGRRMARDWKESSGESLTQFLFRDYRSSTSYSSTLARRATQFVQFDADAP